MAVAKKRNIRRSAGFDKKEMEGYFMIANKDAAIAIINKLTGSQLRLWLYLMMVDSFADLTTNGEKVYHSIPSPQEIAIKIGVSPETVEKDIRKLKKLGLYEYRTTAWQGHNLSAAKARVESDRLKKKRAETKSPQSEGLNKPFEGLNKPPERLNKKKKAETKSPQSEGLNKPPERLNKPPERLNKPPERLNKPPERLNKPPENPEPLEKSGTSDCPQTIQTYTDFKKTLSEDERENFLNYVEEAIRNLEKPINDLEAWLASKNAAEQNRWEVYYQNYQQQKTKQKPRNSQQNQGSDDLSPEKKRAIAEFRKRMKLDQPIDEPESEDINSEEYQQQKAKFDELLSSPPERREKSLAEQRREAIAHAQRKQEELNRQRKEAAANWAKQLDPDLERRKAEMLRQIEELNQRQQQQNTEINLEDSEHE